MSWWARAHEKWHGKLEKKKNLEEFLELKILLTERINSTKELNSRRHPSELRIDKLKKKRGKEITQNIW